MGKEDGECRWETRGPRSAMEPFRVACAGAFETVCEALPAECAECLGSWRRDPTLFPDDLVLELAEAAAHSSSSSAAAAVLRKIAAELEEIISEGTPLPHPLHKEALGLLRDFCSSGSGSIVTKRDVEAVRAKVLAVIPHPVPLTYLSYIEDICARRSAEEGSRRHPVQGRYGGDPWPALERRPLRRRYTPRFPLPMQGNELPVWNGASAAAGRRRLELARALWRGTQWLPSVVMYARKNGKVALFRYAHRRQ